MREQLYTKAQMNFRDLTPYLTYALHIQYLLRWHIEGLCPHVYLFVDVHTGNDEEDPRTPGSTRQQPTQPEYYRPLVFLTTDTRKSKTERRKKIHSTQPSRNSTALKTKTRIERWKDH
jgi:hypothetical protein